MPTRFEFELAAALFDEAADQVGSLTSMATGAEASGVLLGGTLGRQVPQRIAAAAGLASSSRSLIESAAQTCRMRAATISAYEGQLAIYDQRYALFMQSRSRWQQRIDRWLADSTDLVRWPGPPPTAPLPPSAPPAWADVRRL